MRMFATVAFVCLVTASTASQELCDTDNVVARCICKGVNSCEDFSISSGAPTTATCKGKGSCKNIKIDDGVVVCTGENSCMDATVRNAEIRCRGSNACMNAQVYNSTFQCVQADGIADEPCKNVTLGKDAGGWCRYSCNNLAQVHYTTRISCNNYEEKKTCTNMDVCDSYEFSLQQKGDVECANCSSVEGMGPMPRKSPGRGSRTVRCGCKSGYFGETGVETCKSCASHYTNAISYTTEAGYGTFEDRCKCPDGLIQNEETKACECENSLEEWSSVDAACVCKSGYYRETSTTCKACSLEPGWKSGETTSGTSLTERCKCKDDKATAVNGICKCNMNYWGTGVNETCTICPDWTNTSSRPTSIGDGDRQARCGDCNNSGRAWAADDTCKCDTKYFYNSPIDTCQMCPSDSVAHPATGMTPSMGSSVERCKCTAKNKEIDENSNTCEVTSCPRSNEAINEQANACECAVGAYGSSGDCKPCSTGMEAKGTTTVGFGIETDRCQCKSGYYRDTSTTCKACSLEPGWKSGDTTSGESLVDRCICKDNNATRVDSATCKCNKNFFGNDCTPCPARSTFHPTTGAMPGFGTSVERCKCIDPTHAIINDRCDCIEGERTFDATTNQTACKIPDNLGNGGPGFAGALTIPGIALGALLAVVLAACIARTWYKMRTDRKQLTASLFAPSNARIDGKLSIKNMQLNPLGRSVETLALKLSTDKEAVCNDDGYYENMSIMSVSLGVGLTASDGNVSPPTTASVNYVSASTSRHEGRPHLHEAVSVNTNADYEECDYKELDHHSGGVYTEADQSEFTNTAVSSTGSE